MMDNPQDVDKLVSQGEHALVNEEWKEALARLNQALTALQQNPETAPAAALAEIYNGRGVALLQLDSPQEAIVSLQKAVELMPTMAGAYYNLALCYEVMGDDEQALKFYGRAIELEPQDAEAYFRRGGVYFMREEFEKTVADNTKAIELHGESAITGPLIARGLAYHRLEKLKEAQADYTQAVDADPRGAAEAYFYRALVFIDQDEAMPARADLQAYLLMAENPDDLLGQQAREILEELDKADV